MDISMSISMATYGVISYVGCPHLVPFFGSPALVDTLMQDGTGGRATRSSTWFPVSADGVSKLGVFT